MEVRVVDEVLHGMTIGRFDGVKTTSSQSPNWFVLLI
jgi:hypothetical protein